MKNLLIGLVLIGHSGIAQDFNKALGYFIDLDGNELAGFSDLDYDGHVLHHEIYSLSTEYVEGYYMDINGEKHQGFINGPNKYGISYSNFFFKTSLTSTSKKIKATKVKYYKTKLDSFFVKSQFSIRKKSGSVLLKNRFLGLVTENEDMSVYQFVMSGTPYYLMKRKGEDRLVPIPENKKNFKLLVEPIFNSSLSFSSRLRNANYDYDESDFISIVKNYEMELRLKSDEKTWYNENWIECDEDQAAGYMNVIDQVDSVFTVEYYDKNSDRLILRGQYSSMFPARKEGKFEWYYSNGNLRKVGYYSKNKQGENFVEYYENGQVHRTFNYAGDNRKYEQVFSATREQLLTNGSGKEVYYDSLRDEPVSISRIYKNGKIVQSYYQNDQNLKVYQWTLNRPLAKSGLRKSLTYLGYNETNGANGIEGSVIIRAIINAEGKFGDFEILKGVSPGLDAQVMGYLDSRKNLSPVYKPARIGKEKVPYETILTFSFAISGKNEARNSYYDWSFMHQMQFQMMMNQPLNLPNIPSPPPSFH